jgi:hypothetical protein
LTHCRVGEINAERLTPDEDDLNNRRNDLEERDGSPSPVSVHVRGTPPDR